MTLHARLAELAALGATAAGIDRALFTAPEHAARERFAAWARAAGLRVEQDRAGNVFARLDGREDGPPVQTGSHLDTVRDGGAYASGHRLACFGQGQPERAAVGRIELPGEVAAVLQPVKDPG